MLLMFGSYYYLSELQLLESGYNLTSRFVWQKGDARVEVEVKILDFLAALEVFVKQV